VVWSAANGICAKRLVPFLPELIPTLERHGHLVVTDTVRGQLLALSPATVDRLLRPLRQPHGLSTTKPGRRLKHQIPIRTFAEWTDVKLGFLEGDLVAHCGGTTDGAFLYTFTLTDIATTWTECLALLHRSQHGVVQALELLRIAAYIALIDAALESWVPMLSMTSYPLGFRVGEGLDLTSDAVVRGLFVAALLALPLRSRATRITTSAS
jgi:hypothetical protein